MLRLLVSVMATVLFIAPSFAQDCGEQCPSPLLRVEVAADLLNNGKAEGLLPSLKKMAESPTLESVLQKGFPLKTIGFPHNKETCEREKAEGDPDFRDIDCESASLCSDTGLKPSVRDKLCFKLPCAILEGNLNVGKCKDVTEVFPTEIEFPEPVNIQKMKLTPTKVEFENGVANLCFTINELDIRMSTSLKLDVSKTDLTDRGIEISNINPVLDAPKDICIKANIDIASGNPVSNIRIIKDENTPFISDEMIRQASGRLEIKGLSGYSRSDLRTIQSDVVPVLFHPIRNSVEKAVHNSLEKIFEEKISGSIRHLISGTTFIDSKNFMNELGITNIQVKNQLAILECAQLKAAGRSIPPKHPCRGQMSWGKPIDDDFDSSPGMERSILEGMIIGKNVTSEDVKRRLLALKEPMSQIGLPEIFKKDRTPEQQASTLEWYRKSHEKDFEREILPMVESIEKAQLESQLYNMVGIESKINEGLSTSVGLVIPEICSPEPSPFAGRRIKNCPVQVYADLIQFNKVLSKMWDTGRLCMKGKGSFKPQRDEKGTQKYTEEGKPLVESGCELNMGGMSCYVKTPPQLKYDYKTRKYNVGLDLTNCYRGPVIFGLAKFGADFKIDFAFEPKACANGDFCMDKPEAKWSIVPGTERFSLKKESFFDEMIKEKIDQAVTGAVKDTIRIPMTSGAGPLGNIPLQAEGRVDSGPGYFGVCLELQKGASGQ
ncbi:MAG: hypothetical protein ACLGHN_14200 [Bacteriovoracia bacterium]